MASTKSANKPANKSASVKTRSASSVSDTQPTISEALAKSEASEGSEKSGSDTDKIIKLLSDWDKKWEKRFELLQGSLNGKIEAIDKKIGKVFGDLSTEIETLREQTKQERLEIKAKVDGVEKSIDFHAKEVDSIRNVCESLQNELKNEPANREEHIKHCVDRKVHRFKDKVDQRLKELNKNLLRAEKNDRKYNLLFYGVPQSESENPNTVLRDFMVSTLSMGSEYVNSMSFVNVHRLPNSRDGPKPMIARFVFYEEREAVFTHARNLPKGMRILSDLPVVMKTARNSLASEAYKLRNPESGDKLQTRILERDLQLILETRKNSGEPWRRHSVQDFDS